MALRSVPSRRPPAGDPAAAGDVPASSTKGVVRSLPSQRSDEDILVGLREGAPWAKAALYDRYASQMEAILRRLLSCDRDIDLADLLQEVFVQAFSSIDGLRDGRAALGWLQIVASRVAYRAVRRKRLQRWLRFWEPSELPEVAVDGLDPLVQEAFKHTLSILERMTPAERMAFTLRFVEGWELDRVAEACAVSLATVKRRIARASEKFEKAARQDEALEPWMERGTRWPS